MQNKYDDQILDNLAELNDTEIYTFSHECHMTTWQWFFTCCS